MTLTTQPGPKRQDRRVLSANDSHPFEESATMPSSRINRALQQALSAPASAQNLARFIATFQRKHPFLLNVEKGELDAQLNALLTDYVQLLPVLLVELDQACEHNHCAPASRQLLAILDQFFAAIEPARFDYGLVGVLDKVYFGHRLVEELHDRLKLSSGRPLLSWDTNLANLLMHTLIGDGYANRLDLTAQEIIADLPVEHDHSDTAQPQPAAADWPCLVKEHGMSLLLS